MRMTETEIKQYFLGELAAPQAEYCETEVTQDAALSEFAAMIESELIDDYLRGGLSEREKSLFENNYLTTPARRQKVADGQIFLNNLAAQRTAIIPLKPRFSFFSQLFGGFQLSAALALGAILVLLLGGLLIFRLNRQNTNEIAGRNNSNQTSPVTDENNSQISTANENALRGAANSNLNPSLIQPKITPTVSAKPTPTISIKPTPKFVEPAAPTLAVFTLTPGTLRDGGEQLITLNSAVRQINLRLTLPPGSAPYQTYQAIVKTADGATVSTISNLTAPNLKLPAAKLSNNNYIIFLNGMSPAKPAESIAEYTFRVNREKNRK